MPNSESPQDAAAQRGQQRLQRTALTGIATLFAKGSGVAFSYLAIPLAAGYLGTERFGVWLVIGNFLAWVTLADLGLGNNLVNLVSAADASDDLPRIKKVITTSLGVTLLISLSLLLMTMVGYPLVNWRSFFNLSSAQVAPEAALAVLIAMAIFAARLLLAIPVRLYNAYQEGYLYQLWAGLGSVFALLGLLLGTWQHVNLALLIGLFFGGISLADLFAAFYLFGYRRPQIVPRWKDFDSSLIGDLLRQGGQFWILQVTAIIYLQTDLFIVAQLFGASAVASYGVAFKLFAITDLFQVAFLIPLWPAYSEALARKDLAWIVTTFRRSIYWSILWSVGSGLLLWLLTPIIVGKWLGATAVPQNDLMAAMFCLGVTTAISKCIAYLLNGLGQLAGQATYGTIAAFTNVLLSIALGKIFGLSGVTWSTVFCISVFSIVLVGRDAQRTISNFAQSLANPDHNSGNA
jgi:O-antigen/teichoic acid export membrane protein